MYLKDNFDNINVFFAVAYCNTCNNGNLGRFPFVRTGEADHCWTSHFDDEISFFLGFLLKNYLLSAHYLGFD